MTILQHFEKISKPLKDQVNLKKYHDGEKNNYHCRFLTYIETQKKYLSKIKTYNLESQTAHTHEYNFEKIAKDNYIYNKLRALALVEDLTEKNSLIPVFVTTTLPSKFHLFSNKKINPRYSFTNTINDGYKILQSYHRSVYKNFKIKNESERWENVAVKFINVTEPTKQFIPHTHAIYFIKEEQVRCFKKHLRSCRKHSSVGKIKDVRVLKKDSDGNYNISYLLKYFQKTASPNNLDYSFEGWKKENKIIAFKCSKASKINRNIFKRVSWIERLKFTNEKKENYKKKYGTVNSLKIIEQLTTIKKITLYESGEEVITKTIGEFEKYFVLIKQNRIINPDYFLNEECEKYKYIIEDFKIYKREYRKKILIYDKKNFITVDFNLLERNENY